MIPIVPLIKSVVQESQQLFTAKDEFEKKQNELMQLIIDITQSLDQVEYFDNIQEELYTYDEKQFIKQCKDLLHQSEQLVQQLPSNLTKINGYLYSKTNNYKELLQHLQELNKISSQIRSLELQSYEVLKTVVVFNQRSNVNNDSKLQAMHEVQIFLKLKAPKEIQDIFNQYPRHLKSEYAFKFQIDDSLLSKKCFQFFKKGVYETPINKKMLKFILSQKQHCSLEIRNIQQNQYIQQKSQILKSQFTSLHQEQHQEQENKAQLFRLYLVVNGQNGISIIRDKDQRIYVGCGQDFCLQEKDKIIILQNSNQETLISYNIKRLIIKQL